MASHAGGTGERWMGSDPPSAVLVERSFDVPLARGQVWSALADVESWPHWAPHISRARVMPPGPIQAQFRRVPLPADRAVAVHDDRLRSTPVMDLDRARHGPDRRL
jgi:hypothetical protein